MPKKRININMDDDLWARIKRNARVHNMSASKYISQKMDAVTHEDDREARRRAVRELASLNIPVGTWEEMEEEIMRGRLEGLEDLP
jgi:hypothetical protein